MSPKKNSLLLPVRFILLISFHFPSPRLMLIKPFFPAKEQRHIVLGSKGAEQIFIILYLAFASYFRCLLVLRSAKCTPFLSSPSNLFFYNLSTLEQGLSEYLQLVRPCSSPTFAPARGYFYFFAFMKSFIVTSWRRWARLSC